MLCCCVAVCFGVSAYLLLSREMKAVAMGVFLLSHAANLAILAVSGSPVIPGTDGGGDGLKRPPVSGYAFDADLRSGEVPAALGVMVDPLPQALILTAIVIGFAVMGLTLTLLVVTARAAGSMDVAELAAIKPAAAGEPGGPGLDGGLAAEPAASAPASSGGEPAGQGPASTGGKPADQRSASTGGEPADQRSASTGGEN